MTKRRRRKKKGSPYEEVVAEVIRAMDPGATVLRGAWIAGPDGQREIDVRIIGTHEGQQRKILIECKDFNPASTGPVGIGYVDALESKGRDLQCDFAALCSNAGFTEGAVRKATRVGIGLISVMRRGDKRVRFSISEEIFTRKIQVSHLSVNLEGPSPISLDGISPEDIHFQGLPVGNWVAHRVMAMIAFNPIVSGSFKATNPFVEPLDFELPTGTVKVTQLNFNLSITGGWFAQQVAFDATQGIYDWIRHRVRLAPGPWQFLIHGVDVYAGEPVERPPNWELEYINAAQPGEFMMRLVLVNGLAPQEPTPDLNSFLLPEDLDLTIPDLPDEAITSVGA